MDISAALQNEATPQPGSLAQWLAAHPELLPEFGVALLKLVEPQNSFATVKSLATGRYVFASAGLANWFDRNPVLGGNDNDLVRPTRRSPCGASSRR